MFVELVKLGNKAKGFGQYLLANIIFAALLDEFFRLSQAERTETEGGPPPAVLIWETKDEIGEYYPEVYYDLLNIETYEYFPESGGYKIHRLCIPVPLLLADVAITALKAASIEERREHGRQCQPPSDEDITDLWHSLFSLESVDMLVASARYNLDLDKCGLTLADL